jgi:hypothetical protein
MIPSAASVDFQFVPERAEYIKAGLRFDFRQCVPAPPAIYLLPFAWNILNVRFV